MCMEFTNSTFRWYIDIMNCYLHSSICIVIIITSYLTLKDQEISKFEHKDDLRITSEF